MDSISLIRPDDLHLHLRDGDAMRCVVEDTARQFARAIIMPNLKPPVTTVRQAEAYRERILSCLSESSDFQPLMTLYLTDNTAISEIKQIAENEHVHAIKYYPAGATTNSDHGVTDIEKVYPLFEYMADLSIPLLIHGEVTDPEIDIFDREKVFIEQTLLPLINRFENLRVVLEHITTSDAVAFVQNGPETLAATITAHHLIQNRNALFENGIRPHNYCLPVLKRESHRQALLDIVASGHPRFFLGSDSAPHAREAKESACGCAGVYSAHSAIELYASVFEELGVLDKFEAFASFNGADFYGLARNTGKITLEKVEWVIPESFAFADSEIVPFLAGEKCNWKLKTV
ncbi:MAG: dihydroorotase [Gammaproteobacteria bacterium]|nr:dihydroorotase [Gammaproteobacteria bacterium]